MTRIMGKKTLITKQEALEWIIVLGQLYDRIGCEKIKNIAYAMDTLMSTAQIYRQETKEIIEKLLIDKDLYELVVQLVNRSSLLELKQNNGNQKKIYF